MSRLRLQVNGVTREVEVLHRERERAVFSVGGRNFEVALVPEIPSQRAISVPESRPKKATRSKTKAGGKVEVQAPIPGVVIELLVKEGIAVTEGTILLRLEAMKMENNIFAPATGTVTAIHVKKGDEVKDGDLLIELTPS